MSSAATVPNQITNAQILGGLLGIDLATAQAVLANAPAQTRPIGLAVIAANSMPAAQLAIGIRPRTVSPFAF